MAMRQPWSPQANRVRDTMSFIPIREPKATPSRPSIRAFLELAFRPLYIGGAAWAIVSIAIWIYAPQWLTGPLQGVAWHAHEMLWGFVATIALAFLMTAGANWTGRNPLKNGALAVACGLWLMARIGFLVDNQMVFWLATASELGFFLLGAVAMMRVVYGTRNARNYAVPWALLFLGLADLLFLLAAYQGNYVLLMQRFNAGMLIMAVLALLIARRVVPFFAMRAVPGLQIPMHKRSGQIQVGICALAAFLVLSGPPSLLALALAASGMIALWQVASWKPQAVMHNPLLWILYIGHAGLGIGLILASAATAGWILRPAIPVHVIALAGFSVLIIGMLTRTALGHLGRPLKVDRSMVASYVLVLIALALRFAAFVPSALVQHWLHLSAACWIAAFALYLWRFSPMLIRPRR